MTWILFKEDSYGWSIEVKGNELRSIPFSVNIVLTSPAIQNIMTLIYSLLYFCNIIVSTDQK